MGAYIVVGAGVAGCAAALEIARAGHRVEVLEADGRIGGKALSYCCKATDSCSRCGVCTAHDLFAEALAHPGITFRTATTVRGVATKGGKTSIRVASTGPGIDAKACIDCGLCIPACPSGSIHRYQRGGVSFHYINLAQCVDTQGEPCSRCRDICPTKAIQAAGNSETTLKADGTLVAIGHSPFDPVKKPRLGFGRFPNVYTGAEAEETLSRRTNLTRDGEPAPENVAFIQCVGSRDPVLKRNWCSAVCCAYALRMARLLKHRNPKAEITVYAIDIQNFDKAFGPLRAEIEGMGVKIVRGVPSSVGAWAGGKLRLLIEDPRNGARTAEHDAVVLSVGLGPEPEAARLASLFSLVPDGNGFLPGEAPGVRTAGTCAEPQAIPDSMAQARAAALDLLSSRVSSRAGSRP